MGTVTSDKVQTDDVIAKNGAGIPNNLRSLTPLCYGCIQYTVLTESMNVASIKVKTTSFRVTMNKPASDVRYVILATRDGDGTANYTVTYGNAGGGLDTDKTTLEFSLFSKADASVGLNSRDLSFMVFDKGQTI